jgi:hypothetical protein
MVALLKQSIHKISLEAKVSHIFYNNEERKGSSRSLYKFNNFVAPDI